MTGQPETAPAGYIHDEATAPSSRTARPRWMAWVQAHVPPPVAPTRLPARLVAVLGLLMVMTRFPGFITDRPFNSDEATLAVGGRTLAEGGGLYVDMIDRKPPLPFVANAVLRGYEVGDGLVLMRVVVGLLVFAAAIAVAREAARRDGPRAAWVAGIVVVVASAALGPADALAANFELFALLPIALAFTLASRGRAWSAGAWLAVAVLCKQPAAVMVLPVAICLWRRGGWRSVAGAGVGGAVAALAISVPFGLGLVTQWALLGNGGYLSASLADLGFIGIRALAAAALVAGFWGGAWLLALWPAPKVSADGVGATGGAGAAVGGGAGRAAAPRDDELWWFLGASVLGVVAGFRFFPHYFLQLVPALALLAGRGAVRRPGLVRPALAWMAVSAMVAFGLAWVASGHTEPSWEGPVAAEMASEGRCGPVLVWGNVPELYWKSGTRPAGGFTHTEFLTGYSGGRRHKPASEATVPDRELYDDWIGRVRRDRPPLIVDTAAADLRGGELFPIRRFGAVQRLLDEHYMLTDTIEGIRIYHRRPEPPTVGAADPTEGCPS